MVNGETSHRSVELLSAGNVRQPLVLVSAIELSRGFVLLIQRQMIKRAAANQHNTTAL